MIHNILNKNPHQIISHPFFLQLANLEFHRNLDEAKLKQQGVTLSCYLDQH